MANANAATFDGLNDSALRGADLDGNADSQLLSFSLWFKRATISTEQRIYGTAADNSRIGALPAGNDRFVIRFENTATGATALLVYAGPVTDTTSWHHILGSFDMSEAGKRHLYLDDVSDLNVITYNTGDTLDFTQSEHGLGARQGPNDLFDGCLAEVWIAFGTYIDFSVEANRRKFVTADLKAVDLGSDGSTPTGSQPIMYFANAFGTFQTNLGTGGGFTENGELTECTGPEIAADIATGTAVSGLPSLAQAGVGVETFTGAGAQALAAATQQATGVMQPSGTGVQALPGATQQGAGVESIAGAGAETLPSTTQQGAGQLPALGTGAQQLAAATQAGIAVLLPSGTGAQDLPSIEQQGAGQGEEEASALPATGGTFFPVGSDKRRVQELLDSRRDLRRRIEEAARGPVPRRAREPEDKPSSAVPAPSAAEDVRARAALEEDTVRLQLQLRTVELELAQVRERLRLARQQEDEALMLLMMAA